MSDLINNIFWAIGIGFSVYCFLIFVLYLCCIYDNWGSRQKRDKMYIAKSLQDIESLKSSREWFNNKAIDLEIRFQKLEARKK